VELITSNARFVAPRTAEIELRDGGERTISEDRLFLDLGSRAAMPEIPGCVLVKMPMAEVLRARTVSQQRGLMKMLIAKESDEILGFTVLGFEASELMAAAQTAILGHLPYTMLPDAIFAHPTISEGLNQLLAGVPKKSAAT
jgi:pyruvate/2-oxoglutarate dehydrogenase complex dihydrolipoamide dehydrogenase (E3) component